MKESEAEIYIENNSNGLEIMETNSKENIEKKIGKPEPWYKFLIEKPRRLESPLKAITSLNKVQALTYTAAFCGWTLDALDFHISNFALVDVAKEFDLPEKEVAAAITISLILRPLGAVIFGLLGDRFGRRTPLMLDILLFSIFGLLTGFAQNFTQFLIIRAFFGICMGGEWGLGASLAFEVLPPESRGIFSGFLQQGYALGYLLASLLFLAVQPTLGWRAMFWIGSFPAFLVLFIRFFVPESEAWQHNESERRTHGAGTWLKETGLTFRNHWKLFLFTVLFMTGISFMSHGTQDLFPTYLRSQLGYTPSQVTTTIVVQNIGAIIGGTSLGYLSQYFGRRRSIALACFLGICAVPIWGIAGVHNHGVQILGAFLLQFSVQGALGIVPAYLTEISPEQVRGTFPGTTYQIGTLISASAAQIEAILGDAYRLENGKPNYGLIQSIITWIFLSLTFIIILCGRENLGKSFIQSNLSEKDKVDEFDDFNSDLVKTKV